MFARSFVCIFLFALTACGGGGDGGGATSSTSSTQEILSSVQKKLDEETQKFVEQIATRASSIMSGGEYPCSDSTQNLIFSSLNADTLTALDDFVLWILRNSKVTTGMKYEIGKLIDSDDFVDVVGKAYEDAVAVCSHSIGARHNAMNYKLVALARKFDVQASLRKSGLLAP
jgi:hypothetical protein